MPADRLRSFSRAALVLLAASAVIGGCGVLPPPARTEAPAAPGPAGPPALHPDAVPVHPLEQVLAYADRVRGLSAAELSQEIARMGDGGDTAVGMMESSILLAQARGTANTVRAQALLQRVLGRSDEQARALRPLARLLAAQLSDARRVDEQIERQAQLLREAQRRADQLNERLEALRAIERSLPSRPSGGASAPAARP